MAFRTFETEEEFLAAAAEANSVNRDAELARVTAIDAVPMARLFPDVVNPLRADGKSTAADVALAILTADQKTRTDYQAALREDAPAPVQFSQPDINADARLAGRTVGAATQAETTAQIRQHQAKAKAQGRTLTPAQALTEINSGKR